MAREIGSGKRESRKVVESIVIGDGIDFEPIDTTGRVAEPTDSESDSSDCGESHSDTIINPADIAAGGSGDSGTGTGTGKRRGRKPGVRNSGSSRKEKTQTQETLESLLLSVHFMGARLLKIPELELSEDEGKKLASAVNRVAEMYDVTVIPEKTLAWINLATIAGTIYGPRVIAASINKKRGLSIVPIKVDENVTLN